MYSEMRVYLNTWTLFAAVAGPGSQDNVGAELPVRYTPWDYIARWVDHSFPSSKLIEFCFIILHSRGQLLYCTLFTTTTRSLIMVRIDFDVLRSRSQTARANSITDKVGLTIALDILIE